MNLPHIVWHNTSLVTLGVIHLSAYLPVDKTVLLSQNLEKVQFLMRN